MEQLKAKIRTLRAQMGWTQEELARRIDVSLSTVQRWETKGSRPTRLGRRELKKLFVKAGLDGDEN